MKPLCFNLLKRTFSSEAVKTKICIVGAGPAGFYSAQHLAKKLQNLQIDIYERLPVPFGLVRFGVAPDHPEVKNVINTFTKTANLPNVNFIGNVNLGTDVTLKQLRQAYNTVLLTYGAEESRKLNIPGEDLNNVISARRIVGWYNGTPWDADLKIDLSGESVAIFGQGNVAIDVARILLTPVDKLKQTDITQHSLEALSKSKVKKVYLIGRRGPLQAAFTIAELREMLRLENCATRWNCDDFNGVKDIIPSLARPKKRITELMLKSAFEPCTENCKNFIPKFFRSPLELNSSEEITIGDIKKVQSVKLGLNILQGDEILRQQAVLTEARETLPCDLAVTSIGYKSLSVDHDIPFDLKKGVALNKQGKIEDNLYAAGWLATGPTGVILTTMSNAFAIADLIVKDVQSELSDKRKNIEVKPGFEFIAQILKKKNIPVVNWKGWEKIDKFEEEEGKKIGKPREKILDVRKMLEVSL